MSAPVHGNYRGYYLKRPFVIDPRLQLLPPDLFQNARVLDIGCNEGWVTCEIAQSWGAKKVVGVDLDEALIRAAWRRRRTVWSLELPPDNCNQAAEPDTDATTKGMVHYSHPANYFPASCEHMFGALPIPPQDSSTTCAFPHNVTFQTADWTRKEIRDDLEGYDVVVGFSISKWVHLNDGDEGLMRFFKRIYEVLSPGGIFVFEPQEWSTYAKAKRMDSKLRENARDIKIHPESFDQILQDLGFSPPEHLGRVGEGGFRRSVDLYRKIR